MSRLKFNLIISTLFVLVSAKHNPVVDLPNLGKLEGRYEQSLSGRTIHSFEGVPYARPPVGKRRFREPSPVKSWKGIWEAKTLYRCMQYNQYTPPGQDYVVGDEDCLYANIYSPNLNQNAKLDVIVYIHGGSFMFNYGGLYRPDYLLDKDVVFVTLNYRLGPLGFLSTEDDVVPGNNGLKDQILALQFIRNNIQHFGGNPNSITIAGNSAGGVSVHFHYLMPKSRGLFHRGFSLSGSTLVPWGLMEKPIDKTLKIAAIVGCFHHNIEKLVDCLKTRPGRQIVSTVKQFQPWLYLPFSPFGPVVDSWSSEPLLPSHPYNLLKIKQVYDIPWIVSYTSSEGLYPSEEFYEKNLGDVEERWNELIPLILDYNYTVETHLQNEVSQKIRSEYLGEQKLAKATFSNFVSILSDRLFVNDIQKAAQLQSSAIFSPVYCYQFAYHGKYSWFMHTTDDGRDYGAAHADDVPYAFKLKAMDTTTTQSDREMIKIFLEMMTSYAKTGIPKVPIEWPPLSKKQNDPLTCLKIISPGELVIENEAMGREKFWASLPIKENEKLFVVKDEL